jgi:hypothetical protein
MTTRASACLFLLATLSGCFQKKQTAAALQQARAAADATCTAARAARSAASHALDAATTSLESAKAAVEAASKGDGRAPKGAVKRSMYDTAMEQQNAAERRVSDLRQQMEAAASAESAACPEG